MIVGVPKEIKTRKPNRSRSKRSESLDSSRSPGPRPARRRPRVWTARRRIHRRRSRDRPHGRRVVQPGRNDLEGQRALPAEYPLLRDGQILYLHLAPDPAQTKALVDAGVVGIAYETVELHDGSLPLLVPMSEVAGRLSIQAGAHSLEKHQGGRGVLMGGVPGVEPAKVMVLGGGIVGLNAAKMAIGMGAEVTLLDINLDRMRWFDNIYQGRIKTLYSNPYNIERCLSECDLAIGAVLIPGAKARTSLLATCLDS